MSHYQNLGLPNTASQDDVKRAYRKLAKKYHPDRNKERNAASKFISINDSYEWIMSGKGDIALNNYKQYTQPKRNWNPVNKYDLDGDGKLSKQEWKKMKQAQTEEAARAFYNMHETSIDFRLKLALQYIFLLLFSGLILWGGIALISLMKTPDPKEQYGKPSNLLLFIVFGMFASPMLLTLSGVWGVKENKVYMKIIRKKFDPKFRILGFLWF